MLPKVKRETLYIISWPTVLNARPIPTSMKAMASPPPVNLDKTMRPKAVSAKYSGAPNLKANWPRMGAKIISSTTAIVPAINEPTAETASAAPARPRLVIW